MTSGLNVDRPYAAVEIFGGNATSEIRIARFRDAEAARKNVENTLKPEPASAPQTRARAERALHADPLSIDAFQQLGRAAEQAGDAGLAIREFAEAYRRSFRDVDAAGRLLQNAYDSGDFDKATLYSDALLREMPSLTQALTPLLAKIVETPTARKSFAEALARAPVWRSRFLAQYGASGGNQEAFEDLIGLLKATSRPMTSAEIGPYLNNLLSQGMVDEALTIWLAFQPEANADAMPLLVNGDFKAPVNDLPFNWSATNSDNARVSIVDALTGARGKAVEIEFLNRRGVFANVSQVLALTPGKYRLSGKLRTDEFRNPRGVYWKIYCGVREGNAIAESERMRGEPGGWRPFSVSFDVPASNCAAQLLRLELAARIPQEQVASGTVWFSELAIDRLH
ncbi:MAG: tetratricopeptide repeat protein [Rhodoblastus sp.]